MNEDVFAAPSKDDITVSYEEVKDLQAKIYKLFLQVIFKSILGGVFLVVTNYFKQQQLAHLS